MTDPFDLTTAPITEPESIILGTYAAWRRELSYDDAVYSLKYVFTPLVSWAAVEIAGNRIDEDFWSFELIGTATSAWATGQHRWDLMLTRISDGEQYVLYSGQIRFFATSSDRRTHAEIMVEKINGVLEGRAASDVESYTIKSRSLTKMSVKELTDWREYYMSEIRRTGGSVNSGHPTPKKNTVLVRFT